MRRLLALLLILVPFTASAASLEAGQVLRGRFVQERHLQGFNAPLRSEGSFVLAPGKGLIWRAEKPFAVTTVITPAGVVQEVGGTETMRLPSARLPFLSRFYDMLGGALTGDWRALAGDFTVTRSGDERHWQMEMTPRNADPTNMPFSAIVVKGSLYVDAVRLDKTGGDFDALTFIDQSLSATSLAAEEAAALDAPGRQ